MVDESHGYRPHVSIGHKVLPKVVSAGLSSSLELCVIHGRLNSVLLVKD